MEDGVHLHRDVGGNEDDGGEVEDPAEEVEGAGEEAQDAPVPGARGHGGPVVDTAGGGDRGGQLEGVQRQVQCGCKMWRWWYLGDGCSDEAVVEACH